MPTTLTNTAIVFNDGTTQTTAPITGLNAQLFTSSGTFTVPAGVTKVKVTVIGGGAGGFSSGVISQQHFWGAKGGYAQAVVSGVSGSISVTVGTGGNQGGSGNTSSFGSFVSATGGATNSLTALSGTGSVSSGVAIFTSVAINQANWNGNTITGATLQRSPDPNGFNGAFSSYRGSLAGNSTQTWSASTLSGPGSAGYGNNVALSNVGNGGVVLVEW